MNDTMTATIETDATVSIVRITRAFARTTEGAHA